MQVAELTALHVHIPLKKPIKHASHTRTSTENLVVRCVLADGTEGYGEGVPREYVTGETIDSAIALLKSSDLQVQLGDSPRVRRLSRVLTVFSAVVIVALGVGMCYKAVHGGPPG